MDSTKDVKRFIATIANKEYKEANTSLQKVIEVKLKERIKDAIDSKK